MIHIGKSKIPQAKIQKVRRVTGNVGQKIRDNRKISAIIGFLLAAILSGITKSMDSLNNGLLIPIRALGNWHPTNAFLDWIEFTLLVSVYSGIALVVGYILTKKSAISKEQFPKILYEDELAAAVQAIDSIGTEEDVRERIEDLLYTIAETVATALGLTSKYYRAYFVVSSDAGPAISGFRIGRQFSRAEKYKESIDHILKADAGPVNRMCQRTKTVSKMTDVQDEFPQSDIHQMLMVRNPGNFRMCFLIAALDPIIELNEHDEVFLQVSYIIRSLGFMDNLVKLILEYE